MDNPPKKSENLTFFKNIEVGWWEILLEALEKSVWPSLRNTARTEVFCDRGAGIGHSSSLIWNICMQYDHQIWNIGLNNAFILQQGWRDFVSKRSFLWSVTTWNCFCSHLQVPSLTFFTRFDVELKLDFIRIRGFHIYIDQIQASIVVSISEKIFEATIEIG